MAFKKPPPSEEMKERLHWQLAIKLAIKFNETNIPIELFQTYLALIDESEYCNPSHSLRSKHRPTLTTALTRHKISKMRK